LIIDFDVVSLTNHFLRKHVPKVQMWLERIVLVSSVGVKTRVVITVQLSEEGVLTATKLGVKTQKL